MKRYDSKGQFNFAWLFAILAGGAILFLAIFGAIKATDTSRYQSNTEIAKQLTILTDPLQAGYSQGTFGSVEFNDVTRINNFCYDLDFGWNSISVSTRSDIGEEWNEAGSEIRVNNKYIFSKERTQGMKYYIFSKPFNLPYKVADLTLLISENYCFKDAPDEIEEELSAFSIPNIEFDDCTNSNTTNVCFSSTSNCDIVVKGDCQTSDCDSIYDKGTIIKKDSSEDLYYVENLLYAAIFSDKNNYDCNVNRLLYRATRITEGLIEKSDIMNSRDCSTNLKSDLQIWASELNSTTSEGITSLSSISSNLEIKNEKEICGLW